MTQEEDRLARIENILLATVTGLNQVSQQQQTNTTAIAQLTERMDTGFAELLQQLQESVSYLVTVIGDFVEEIQQDRAQAEQDRAIMREMQTEVKGLQIENRRIMQHLFGQSGDDNEPIL